MKNKIAILLMCASLSLTSQTKVKISQLENPATSSLNLGTQTFSAGTITGSNVIAKGTFSATGNSTINGLTNNSNNITVGTGSVGSTFTVNGAMKANNTLSVAGTSTFNGVQNQGNNITVGTGSVGSTFTVGGASTFSNSILGKTTFSIDASGGVNSLSPLKYSFQQWVTTSPAYPALYMAQNIPSFTNYIIGADSTNGIFNGPTNLFLRANGTSFLQAQTSSTTTANMLTFNAVNLATVAANSFIPHAEFAARKIGWNAGTTTTMYKILISADTHSANAASTITNDYSLWVVKPIQGTNMTITNNNACRFDGDVLSNGNLRVGSTTAPAATLDVTGTMSVSGTPTVNGLRCIGAFSTTTTASVGTNFTVSGTALISGTTSLNQFTNTGVATITGSLTTNGITNTGSVSISSNLLVSSTATVSAQLNTTGVANIGTLTCSGASTLSGAVTVSSNLTGSAGIYSSSKTSFIGYSVGSGSTVTQGTNRTTAVTCNSATGIITLVSAAGLPTYQSFVVNNSGLGANDLVCLNQIAGADKYMFFVSHTSNLAFTITFATTGGTTTEQPSFLFTIIKGQIN